MTDDEVINELLARYNTPSAHGAGGVDKRRDPDVDAMEAYLARVSAPKRMPELRSYDPHWYQSLPDKAGGAVDKVRGALGYEPMGPEGYEWMRKLFGTENPLNLPGQVHEGYDTASRGLGLGDPKQAGLGALQMVMALPLGVGKGPAAAALKQEANALRREAHSDFRALDNHGIMSRTNEAGYEPPIMPQRAFTDDYRGTTQGMDGSPLKTDIEGRPLTAKFVAGRRRVGEDDVGLTPSEIAEIAQAIGSVKIVPRKELPRRAVGSFLPTLNEIKIAADLSPHQAAIALSHETGHAIAENLRSPIKTNAPVAARRIYHILRTGDMSARMPGRFHSPELDGYAKRDVRGELDAERISMYARNPNASKDLDPVGSADIRAAVNSDPWLSKIIQFNALPPVALGAGALGVLDQYYGGDDIDGRRKYSSGGRTDNDTDGLAITGDDQPFDHGVDFGPAKKLLAWASPAAGLAAYAISKRVLRNGNELATPKLNGLGTTIGGWSLATRLPDSTGDTLPPSRLPGETFHGPQPAHDWDTDVSAKRLNDVAPGPEMRAYHPSWTDRIGAMIAGEDRDPIRHNVAHRLLGTSGLGHDRSAPSQILPVVSHAIDATDRANQGEYTKAAGNAALAALDASMLRGIGKGAVDFGAKPFGAYYDMPFNVPFMAKNGKSGEISGIINGNVAEISSAYMNGRRFAVNQVGPKEIRRALDVIRSEYPTIDRVKAFRVTGARHKNSPNDERNTRELADRSRLDMEITPMWRKYLNEASKRGID